MVGLSVRNKRCSRLAEVCFNFFMGNTWLETINGLDIQEPLGDGN